MRGIQNLIAGCLAFSLMGCSTLNSSSQKFTLSTAGYASVSKAPAKFRETPSEANSSPLSNPVSHSLNRKYREEANALKAKLTVEEVGNFSELRLVWEPEFHYLISFRQNADATLAKYTSNPIFRSNTVKYMPEMLEAKQAEFSATLSALYPKYEPANASSVDILKGKVVVHLDMYDEDFETYPQFKPYKNDPMVELNYNGPLDPQEVISAEVKPLIRHFAHGTLREQMIVLGSESGKILLKDGCFFLDGGKEKDRLVVFQQRVGVGLDDEGYIVLIDRSPHSGNKTQTRVGEPAEWYDGTKAVTDLEILTPLQAACGTHEAVIIGAPSPQTRW